MSAENNLKKLAINLPTPALAVANYMPFVITGNLVSISGQLPMENGAPKFLGKVGVDVTPEEANEAARICGMNILAQLRLALDGNLDRVQKVVRLGGFVNCVDGFAGQPAVINGASDLMVEVFGDIGRHSRAAVGVNALPLNVPVEVDGLFEIS